MKINLNQPIKSVEQKENDAVNETVDEDRKILIQVNQNQTSYPILLSFPSGENCSKDESPKNTQTCHITPRSHSRINFPIYTRNSHD